jgi:hypothetical protein
MHLNPALETNSEKWKVKENNKLFGDIRKPEFGPYTTTGAEKLDSPVIKKKTKDGKEFEVTIGQGADIDMSKKVTIEKTKFYRMQLANGGDTTEALFSIFSTSKEKRQTFLGAVLSKKDEGKDIVLSYTMDVNGIITTNADSILWKFFYTNNNSGSNNSYVKDTIQTTPGISGYLKNHTDSLHIELIVDTSTITFKQIFSSKHDTITTYKNRGVVLVNQKGEHLAALQFAGAEGKRYIWIRKDLENSYRQAISTYLAVIIAL